jgi:dihydrofolate synthase/folylpolyglutamate synthase
MEEVEPDIYVDGAHNEPAIRAFCDTISRLYQDKKIILLFAVSSDKSYNEMIRILCEEISCSMVIVTAIEGTRTTPVSAVANLFQTYTDALVISEENLHLAYTYARKQLDGSNRVFCVGSLYLVGSLLEGLEKEK